MNDTIHTKINALKSQGSLQDKLLIEEVLRIVREEAESVKDQLKETELRERFCKAMAAWMEERVREEILPHVNKWSFQKQFDVFSKNWWLENK
jgi:2-polyprenyl-3-methyl-5-hydroxy-6-metoxy-1,4-benzoquinol methylase